MPAEMKQALGLMSGTSMDGIDVAVVTTDGERIADRGPWETLAYKPGLRGRLGEAVTAASRAGAVGDLAALEEELTRAHADAVSGFLVDHRIEPDEIAIVGFHGHTILHRPERRYTRQIGDGALLARLTGLPVVNDFRSADVAAGGQGAPLAPLYHVALARDLPPPVAVLNLGGVGNLTAIDADRVTAFDTGPANAMIDDWVRRHTGRGFDDGGRIAAAGKVDEAALARLLDRPYFALPPPKSLDRNDFPADPVEGLSLEDGAATLAAFTAEAVARGVALVPRPHRVLVTGGGRHNPVLMTLLRDLLGTPVDPVEAVGWDGDALEAQAFGFLAVRSLYGLPMSLPGTTGVPQPLTGGVLHQPQDRAA